VGKEITSARTRGDPILRSTVTEAMKRKTMSASGKRDKRNVLAWVWAVVATCGILAYYGRPTIIKRAESLPVTVCINNMRKIDAAKEDWAAAGGKTNGTPVTASDFEGYLDKYRARPLVCPKGGVYRYGDVREEPSCSYHGTIAEAPAMTRKREKEEAIARMPALLAELIVIVLVLVVAPVLVITMKAKHSQ